MKQLSLISLLLSVAVLCHAKVVPVTTAQAIGYNYLHQLSAKVSSPGDLNLVYTSGKDGTAYFYAFSGPNCFVLVSADDRVRPIIGHATDRGFVAPTPKSNPGGFFQYYEKQIDYVINNDIAATDDIVTQWSDLAANKQGPAKKTTTVTPLLPCQWNQEPYYNDNCPYDAGAGANCPTGCVATATAQVMKFWSWPANGVGVNTYSTMSYGTLSADFGSHTYSWGSMPNTISGPNANIAQLMSDVGISVNMDYGPTESSAYAISSGSPIANCAEYALKTYFSYDPTLHGEARASYPDATWTSMIQTDLDAGRPVIYTGQGTAGGHCFVLDGYDAPGDFHVNWGWGGLDDGYYTIDAMNPASLGTGGGAGGFNSDQQAIFNVKPTGGGTVVSGSLALYDYVNLSAGIIPYYTSFTVSTNIQNTGTSTFTGDFCAAAFDASGTFISYIDSVMATTLPAGDVFTSDLMFPNTGLAAMVPGTYSIGVFARPTGGGWSAVANSGGYTNFVPMTVVNSAPIELGSAFSTTPAPDLVSTHSASVSLTLYNNSGSSWDDSSYVGLYNLDGTYNCDIGYVASTSIAPSAYSSTLTYSTTSVTAVPGTYLLVSWYKDPTYGWILSGADFHTNPILINVVAPPISPDMYEVNNTAATAYDLTPSLAWSSNTAHTSTPGSNFHIAADEDYYKVVLAAGYNYTLTARINDVISADDGGTYTVDAVWSYSTDGGTTWSSVYNDVMTGTPGNISLTGLTGGTVIFHVSHAFAGTVGSYLFKISNITRTNPAQVNNVTMEDVKVYPNPATDKIVVDLSGSNANAIEASLLDVAGRKVYAADAAGQSVITIPVTKLSAGTYFVEITTDAGILNRKITVAGNR